MKRSKVYSLDDLPRVRLASEKAFERIHERLIELRSQRAEQNNPEEDKKPAGKSAKKKTAAKRVKDEREAASSSRGGRS